MRAVLRNYRQAPRKVRLIADLIRGKRVENAMLVLSHVPKKGALPMKKLLSSAVSNAKNAGMSENDLFIKGITVDKGFTFTRYMPRARGRATPINKETSHISVVLGQAIEKNKEAKSKK